MPCKVLIKVFQGFLKTCERKAKGINKALYVYPSPWNALTASRVFITLSMKTSHLPEPQKVSSIHGAAIAEKPAVLALFENVGASGVINGR